MLSAFGVSALFLASYVTHKTARSFENTTYHAEGLAKTLYLAMLASHVVLAALVPVFALLLIRFGLQGEIARHRRLARFAWPAVDVRLRSPAWRFYLLLYHFNPPAA